MFTLAGLEVFEGLVSDLDPFEPDDTDEFIAALPDLALAKFERHAVLRRGETRLSRRWHQERRVGTADYFFLPATCLATTAAFFFATALLALDCF